jgi:hypothetical protein
MVDYPYNFFLDAVDRSSLLALLDGINTHFIALDINLALQVHAMNSAAHVISENDSAQTIIINPASKVNTNPRIISTFSYGFLLTYRARELIFG